MTGVSAATAGPEEDLKSSIKQFTKVYEVVENNFADKVTSDKGIYKGAIPGMLRTLDPHSNFFDPKDFQALRDDQSGHYYGVGMRWLRATARPSWWRRLAAHRRTRRDFGPATPSSK